MALTKIGTTLGSGANTITITQSSHGLLIGRPVKVSGNNTFSHATADSVANAEAVGIVIVTDWNGSSGANTTFTLALSGRVTVDGCVPSGSPGDVLFLATSAGIVTGTEPSGNNEVSKPMAVLVTSTSEMILINYRGEKISTAGATIADDAVTNAKLANMATRTVKANATSGSANPTDVAMADGDFLIANGSALVTVPITGDVVISNAGVATIQTDISCRIHTAQAQELANGGDGAAVIFAAANSAAGSYDTDTMHDPNTNNTRITFTTAGKYFGAFNVEFQAASGGERRLEVKVNGLSGTKIAKTKLSYPDGADHDALQVVWTYDADAGEYIECWAYQNRSSGVLNLNWDGISYPHGWATRIAGS